MLNKIIIQHSISSPPRPQFKAITKTVQSVNGSTFYMVIIAISREFRKKQTNSVPKCIFFF